MRCAKEGGYPLFLVGHVTKDGNLAGPRVLEHMVDTVLYFEGDRQHVYRLLRAVKNRFGATNEIGVFEMRSTGLTEVPNASELFLSQRVAGAAGNVVSVTMEGSRPLLVEIQALCAPASGYALPRRTTSGIDPNRLAMLLAVLEKRAGLPMSSQDVFVNVAGGVRIVEPAVDLAVCLAIASSLRNAPVAANLAAFGEVGLGGELRSVPAARSRAREACNLGFVQLVLPAAAACDAAPEASGASHTILEATGVAGALELVLPSSGEDGLVDIPSYGA
jgi:DNA repair protein RadA/Sms